MSVVLLRHASAGDRSAWDGDDRLRPLDEEGHAQALALADALRGRGISRVVSSPYVRCVESLEPLAEALGLAVELDPRLAEGEGGAGALALLATLGDGVACTHGDVVEAVIGRTLDKGAAAVVELAGGGAHVVELLPVPSS